MGVLKLEMSLRKDEGFGEGRGDGEGSWSGCIIRGNGVSGEGKGIGFVGGLLGEWNSEVLEGVEFEI